MDACRPSMPRPQCSLCVRQRVDASKASAVIFDASLFIRFKGTCPQLVTSDRTSARTVLEAVCAKGLGEGAAPALMATGAS